jgi:transposase InsO family protein
MSILFFQHFLRDHPNRTTLPPSTISVSRRSRRSYPKTIRVDQGSEFVSRDLDLGAYVNNVTLDFPRPGKPTDNAFIDTSRERENRQNPA